MRFAEIDLFGVYVAPMSVMLVAAWARSRFAGLPRDTVCCAMCGTRRCSCSRFT
jgi:hypothetical protein